MSKDRRVTWKEVEKSKMDVLAHTRVLSRVLEKNMGKIMPKD